MFISFFTLFWWNKKKIICFQFLDWQSEHQRFLVEQNKIPNQSFIHTKYCKKSLLFQIFAFTFKMSHGLFNFCSEMEPENLQHFRFVFVECNSISDSTMLIWCTKGNRFLWWLNKIYNSFHETEELRQFYNKKVMVYLERKH